MNIFKFFQRLWSLLNNSQLEPDPKIQLELWDMPELGGRFLGKVKYGEITLGDHPDIASQVSVPKDCSVDNPVVMVKFKGNVMFLSRQKFDEITHDVPLMTLKEYQDKLNKFKTFLNEESIILKKIAHDFERLNFF